MNLPAFTAESSLYRSRNRYRVAAERSTAGLAADSVVLSLSAAANAACDDCEQSCAEDYSSCLAVALATVWLPWLGGGIGAGCVAGSWYCLARCNSEGHACCPTDCGKYCCDYGEQCSHLSGCCPGDRVVCAGRCCAAGDSCCGDRCCNAGQTCCGDTCCLPGENCCGGKCCPHNCCGDTCCDAGVPCCGDHCCSLLPPKGSSPTPPPNHCLFGGAPCGTKCCPPGLECCGLFNGQPDCKTSCLH
jgi:hypothetical protein